MGEGFGDILRGLRLAAGVTQMRLAELSGVSVQAISMLERGQRTQPRIHTVRMLAGALDLSPAESARLHEAVARPGPARTPVVRSMRVVDTVPRSLPPVVGDFTGRSDQVQQIISLLTADEPQSPGSAVVVSVIEGMGGVGKTTLAVRIAHLVADEFPDGQLYLNLQGFGFGDPMTPAEALGRLLGMLGSAATGDAVQAAARYRTILAGKRMLVLLDNARDADQVLPLLPGTAGSAAIVTSRRSLSTLPGARHVQLDVLTEDEGSHLLSAIVGERRAEAEHQAITDVVRRCGQLPLAIRMAGARLAARPGWPVSVLADQLADERRRLDELEVRDAGVRASFLASLRGLEHSDDRVDAAAAAAFPQLGILDSPDLSIGVAARLLDKPSTESEQVLERLVDSHLLDSQAPGRYRLHDLLRTYAREFAVERITPDEREAALIRVLRHYNTVTWQAYAASSPTHVRLRYVDAQWLDDQLDEATINGALAWLIEERNNVAASVQQAAAVPGVPDVLINQLAIASLYELNNGGYWPVLATIARISLRAAIASGNGIAQAFAHHDIGAASTQLQRRDEAIEHMTAAVDLFQAAGDQVGEAMALCNLAYVFERTDRCEDGVEVAERALELCARGGLRHLEATTCLALGLLHGRLGRDEIEYYQRSLTIYAEIGHDRGRARAHYNLGLAHRTAGRPDEAVGEFDRAIELCDLLNLADTASEARTELAIIHSELGQLDRALGLAREAVSLAVSSGSEYAEARARQQQGSVLAGLHRPEEARREWRAALTIYEQLGAPADDVRAQLAVARS